MTIPSLPEWVTYETLQKAIHDLGGPYADVIGLVLLIILVAGIAVRWVILPLRRR